MYDNRNEWERRYGRRRRAIDRAILREAARPQDAPSLVTLALTTLEEETRLLGQRRAIARAFGRPVP